MTNEPLWLSVARMCEGISEIPGASSNPVILKWAKDISAPAYLNDDVAWCAVFANRLAQACQFPLSGDGYDLIRARSFMLWGRHIPEPSLGAWMVFSRPEGFHVGLYLGERADAYCVLGGNTGNSVASAWILRSRLVAQRWPLDVPLPTTGRVTLTNDGRPVSVNED